MYLTVRFFNPAIFFSPGYNFSLWEVIQIFPYHFMRDPSLVLARNHLRATVRTIMHTAEIIVEFRVEQNWLSMLVSMSWITNANILVGPLISLYT